MIQEKFEENFEKKDSAIREKRRERQKRAEQYLVTDADIEMYETFLGIPITKESVGKFVLDLGSGEGTFAKEAAERGVEVYSLSAALNLKRYRDILKEKLGEKYKELYEKSSAGLAQELPFKSDIFDTVVSVEAIPSALPKNQKEYKDAFKEIVRVLKPGGKAYLGPLGGYDDAKEFRARWELVMLYLKREFEKEGIADVRADSFNPMGVIILSKPEKREG